MPDSPYVPAHGAEPNGPLADRPMSDAAERRKAPRGTTPSRGVGGLVWIAVAIVAIAAVVYFVGFGG